MNTIYQHMDLFIKYEHKIDENPIKNPLDYTIHAHELYEIYYFISGSGVYWVEGVEYNLQPGCIMIMRPNEVHNFRVTGDGVYERKNIHFHPDALKQVDPMLCLLKPFNDRLLGRNNMFEPDTYNTDIIRNLFDQMESVKDDPYKRNLAMLTNVYAVLWELYNSYNIKVIQDYKDESDGLVEKVTEYINDNLTVSFDLGLLTDKFNISKTYLNITFKNVTGSTIWQYVLLKRLVLARQKIQSGVNVVEACHDGGFKDYSSFYRQYKKRFGISPKDDVLP